MANHCPICNFLNPHGAQICGECGHVLIMAEASKDRVMKKGPTKAPSGIKWASIGLKRADRETGHPWIIALALCLFTYGLAILILSIAMWFKPVNGLGFICLPAHLYPLFIGIFFGILTMLVAFGIYRQKRWIVIWYLVWSGLQALLLLILWAGWWRPVWFNIKAQMIFSLIIFIQILLFPFILRLKNTPFHVG